MIITVLKAVLEVEPGWAIGAADERNLDVDRDLLTDRDGNPWVPASSLAGSLRAHLAQSGGADIELMGDRPPDGPGQENPAASLLWVLGTTVTAASGPRRPPRTQIVTSTAVDPQRRAARAKSLRTSRIVDEPTVIELYLEAREPFDARRLDLLAGWRPWVGRDRTRGGGAARLRTLGYRLYDLDDADDLMAWLSTSGPERFTGLTEVPITAAVPTAVIDTTLRIVDALHIGTGSIDAVEERKTALTRTRDGRPLIPGSSWKGLFRARAGYILRSVWGEEAACTSHTGCSDCALCSLFGSQRRRGRLVFSDSPVDTTQRRLLDPAAPSSPSPAAARVVPSAPGTKAPARPTPLSIAPRRIAPAAAKVAPTTGTAGQAPSIPSRIHVAIDRITGGARDKMLYAEEIVTSGSFTLKITPLDRIEDWERNLLLHVVRDLNDGLIGVGKGAQRGQGTVALTADSLTLLEQIHPVPPSLPTKEAQP